MLDFMGLAAQALLIQRKARKSGTSLELVNVMAMSYEVKC